MNFLTIDYFITVARERSFTRAAERLFITQQTLSGHIAALEQELGSQLFLRHIPLELTYAGELFLEYALDCQTRHRSMRQMFSDLAHDQQGRLRVGISFTRGRAVMPGVIAAYQTRWPKMQVQLQESTNDLLSKMLTSREADLIIGYFPESLPGAVLEDFYQEELVMLVSRSLLEQHWGSQTEERIAHIRATGDLSAMKQFPFLLNSENDLAGRLGRGLLAASGVTPNVMTQSDNLETLLDLCVRGSGVGFGPENLARAVLTEGQMAGLEMFHFGEAARYTIQFAYLKQPHHWAMLQRFLDCARETLPHRR